MSPLRDDDARYAVLISGSGRTLQNLLRLTRSGELEGRVVAVVSSRADVRGVQIAREAGLPCEVIERAPYRDLAAFSDAVFAAVAPYQPHLLLMAGYLKKLHVPPKWEGRILNIHPALLPEMAAASGKGFYGDRVHEAVLAAGVDHSGATVHVVDNGYDTGHVVLTREVPVLSGDSVRDLADRVFQAECQLYPDAIRNYLVANREWLLATDPD